MVYISLLTNVQGELTMYRRQRSRVERLPATSCRAIGRETSTEAEQPEAENDGGNDETRDLNCLITTQHLATVLPRPQRNYLHAVGNLYSPDEKSRED